MLTTARLGPPALPRCLNNFLCNPDTFPQRKATLCWNSDFHMNPATAAFLNSVLLGICNHARILAFLSPPKKGKSKLIFLVEKASVFMELFLFQIASR